MLPIEKACPTIRRILLRVLRGKYYRFDCPVPRGGAAEYHSGLGYRPAYLEKSDKIICGVKEQKSGKKVMAVAERPNCTKNMPADTEVPCAEPPAAENEEWQCIKKKT